VPINNIEDPSNLLQIAIVYQLIVKGNPDSAEISETEAHMFTHLYAAHLNNEIARRNKQFDIEPVTFSQLNQPPEKMYLQDKGEVYV
jgi:hypothetical protein